MKLYGREWFRRELEARLGRIDQVGGLHRIRLTEGKESGVEEIQVRTGSGLSFSVLPTRGMDIGLAEFDGVPLTWLSPNGEVHPAYFDSQGSHWLRTAVGGLLMTCGLTQVGTPGKDGTEELGLHGWAHHTPARQVSAVGDWQGDEYLIRIKGVIEETSIFGWNLRLSRTINCRLGVNALQLHDVVENAGFEPAPHMLLYHFNFGFPLLDEETKIIFPSRKVTPREPGLSMQGLDGWQTPQIAFKECVYYHEDLKVDSNGRAEALLCNPHFPLPGGGAGRPITVCLAWETRNLPGFVQWKMPGEGNHVLGIEPANCHVEGRLAERERGSLVMLAPGQQLEYLLELSVSEE